MNTQKAICDSGLRNLRILRFLPDIFRLYLSYSQRVLADVLSLPPVFQRLNPGVHIVREFFVRVSGVSCVHPDLTGRHGTFPAVFEPLVVCDALKDRTRFSLRGVEYFSLAGVTAPAHGSIAGTGFAVSAAHAEIRLF